MRPLVEEKEKEWGLGGGLVGVGVEEEVNIAGRFGAAVGVREGQEGFF